MIKCYPHSNQSFDKKLESVKIDWQYDTNGMIISKCTPQDYSQRENNSKI